MKFEEKLARIFLILGILTVILCCTLKSKAQSFPMPIPMNDTYHQEINGKLITVGVYYAVNFMVSEYAMRTRNRGLYNASRTAFIVSSIPALLYVSYEIPIKSRKHHRVNNKVHKYSPKI